MRNLRWFVVIGLVVLLSTASVYAFWPRAVVIPPLPQTSSKSRFLDKYAFSHLQNQVWPVSPIVLEKVLYQRPEFTAYLFSFYTVQGFKITGQMNVPVGQGPFPVVVMLRGYVDKEKYATGVGTHGASEGFARQGFLTVAPDFLGYGGSDPDLPDVWEARFEKPVTVLSLINSLPSFSLANSEKLALWGHSNGGQIALSVLEITGKSWPTSLWAPVTLGFPQAVTNFYTELADKGVYLQKQLDEFSWKYDAREYSLTSHWAQIQAPIQFHQGLKDTLVSPTQTKQVFQILQAQGDAVEYYEYPNENHLFAGSGNGPAVAHSVQFFIQHGVH